MMVMRMRDGWDDEYCACMMYSAFFGAWLGFRTDVLEALASGLQLGFVKDDISCFLGSAMMTLE